MDKDTKGTLSSGLGDDKMKMVNGGNDENYIIPDRKCNDCGTMWSSISPGTVPYICPTCGSRNIHTF